MKKFFEGMLWVVAGLILFAVYSLTFAQFYPLPPPTYDMGGGSPSLMMPQSPPIHYADPVYAPPLTLGRGLYMPPIHIRPFTMPNSRIPDHNIGGLVIQNGRIYNVLPNSNIQDLRMPSYQFAPRR